MGSSMIKTTLREIRQSLGRFLAILAIVALGVGFFSGLKETTPAMVQSGDTYMKEHEFFDLRLLSTIGFDEDGWERLEEIPGVRAVEGAVMEDFLAVDENERESVLVAHTLLDVQNRPELVSGRMPEKADEVVVDANAFSEADIGTQIQVSSGNEEEVRERFAFDTYTIVGRVNSPYYVNYERGTTSLGTGRVRGFLYMKPEGFDMDYRTEIFVRLSGEEEIYSDAYEHKIDGIRDQAELLTQEIADARYNRIRSEAENEIADAEKELADEVAKAEKELADALEELQKGETELADAKEELTDGEKKLKDGWNEIAEKERQLAESKAELADARAQIEGGLAEIAAMKQEAEAAAAAAMAGGMPEGMSADTAAVGMPDAAALQMLQAKEDELKQQLAQVEAGEAQIADGEKQLADAGKTLREKETELEDGRQEIADAEEELADGWKEYEDGKKELEEETADAEAEIADARKDVEEIEKPETYVLGRETNIGYACFENDSAIVDGVADVFPIFFFLVAALVCITTMNRMVEEQRTQIGVLKALGYSEAAIMGKYLFYSGSAALTGAVLGFLAGSFIFPTVIWRVYGIMYTMGELELFFDGVLAVISLLVAMLCSVGTTWLTCRYELMSVPAELIRPKAPRSGKRIWLEYIPFLWNRMSFLVKVSVRNVMRYKRRFFMMVVGIGGCTALLVTGFGIKDSIANIADEQYGKIQVYDIGLTLKDDFKEEGSGNFMEQFADEITQYTAVSERSMDLTAGGVTKSLTVIMPQNEEVFFDYINLYDSREEPIAFPKEGEAVLSDKIAKKCGVTPGSTIKLTDEDGNKLEVKVVAICKSFVENYLYVGAGTWKNQNGEEAEFKRLYVNVPEEQDIHELAAGMMSDDAVTAVAVNEDIKGRFSNMMESLDSIILLIIFSAGSLAFIVLYNLTNINITERIREIATIKVLGFYPMETAAYVFRENVVLTAIGGLVGLVLGKLLHLFVMYKIDIDLVSFESKILPISYVYSMILTFVFMFIVDIVMYIKLDRINMAESLKSVE